MKLNVEEVLNMPHLTQIGNPNEITICCPFCLQKTGKEDIKYKMGINLKKKKGHCFKCGSNVYLSEEESDHSKYLFQNFDFIRDRLTSAPKVIEDKIKEELNLDVISEKLDPMKHPFASAYLKKRGYTLDDIENLNIRVGRDFFDKYLNKMNLKWKGRILLPLINESRKCDYVIGRSYIDGVHPKYLNSKGKKSLYMYKFGELKDEVILCEGVFSAYASHKYTGVSSACLLGKFFSDSQLKLLNTTVKKVYYSLDGDVDKYTRRTVINQLIGQNLEVYVVPLPKDKDPDDLKSNYKKYFDEARRIKLVDIGE
jgi:hypothetical protein